MAAALAFLTCLAPAAAQESATVNTGVDHRLVALRISEDFVEPRYGALLTRMQAQDEAWNTFCSAAPSAENFGQLTDRFITAVNAWASVELVRFGPVSEDFRYERIAYWPERKNNVARGLAKLFSEDDELTPQSLYGKSVAVQGLSALERLLYEEDARAALFAGDDQARRRCAAGRAIAGNLKNITQDIVNGWPVLKQQLSGDEARAREAVTRFATDLLTVYQVVGDLKLDVPMGESAEDARPKSAQWWRSGLSAQTIALNHQAAADFTWIVLGPGEEGNSTVAAIEQAQRMAEDLPRPLPELVADPSQRSRLILLRDAVRGARDLSGAYVPPALGITLGFNSLDGD